MSLPFSKYRSLSLLAVSVVWLSGCVLTPAPKRTSAPPSLKNKIDIQFIQPGQTTREEVEDRLGWGSVDLREKRLFWCRWTMSSSAVFWALGGTGGGDVAPASVGGKRLWMTKNVLIEFDDAGKVRSSQVVADEKLVMQISSMLNTELSQFDSPRTMNVHHMYQGGKDPVKVVLTRDAITYTDPKGRKGKELTFQVSPKTLASVGASKYRQPNTDNPNEIWFTLHFSEKTPAGKNIWFAGSAEDLGWLIRYQMEAARADAASKP